MYGLLQQIGKQNNLQIFEGRKLKGLNKIAQI